MKCSSNILFFAPTLLLAACVEGPSEIPVNPPADVLEGSSVTVSDWQGLSMSVSGPARVSGSGRDWKLQVAGAKADESIELHAPGASDLAFLDGAEVTADLSGGWGNASTVGLSDELGPVFLMQARVGEGPASDLFGADFASWGDATATGALYTSDSKYDASYRDVIFQTDDGAVTAQAGVPVLATIDGAEWRIVLHSAFEVLDVQSTGRPVDCGPYYTDTMSFEMVRVEASEPSLERLTGLPDGTVAGMGGCGG